jgi:hypothetical protein
VTGSGRTQVRSEAQTDDTRCNLVAVAILLAKVEAGEFRSRTFKRWLDKALTLADDHESFGLSDTAAR